MNLVHQLNIKKKAVRIDWLQLHPTKSYHIAQPSHPAIKKLILRIRHRQCPNIPLYHKRVDTMRNV